MAQVETRSGVEVACPAEEAFAVVSDAEQNPTWQRGMRACRWITEPPLAVGSRYEQEASFLGRTITSTFEVVAFDPGREISIRTIASTFPIQVTRTVEPLGEDRCRVSAHVRGDPGRLFALATPFLRGMVRRSVQGDYERLKALLERR